MLTSDHRSQSLEVHFHLLHVMMGRMAGKKTDTGPTGQTVAANLTRIREHKGLTYTQVSKMLAGGGRSISPLAVRRIEDGERKVDADDLMAIASVLDVSPTYFLMPATNGPDDEVRVTGRAEPVGAKQLYDFLHGEHGIEGRPVRVAEWLRYLLATAPAWRVDAAEVALRTLSDFRMADEWRGQESEIPGFRNGND